ncbi:MAG: hydrogenase [Candidatus Wallbacteria bacterium HGW-Wallbacteria-1]|jgi:hydrogenase-4 component E|uniref:Hydrogenase n=1 Tax=Candidatus Wallbacteria bacterium HGW-Wallbacteria-1 TaxID=2013854 RepID=A0A2N1PHQ5_9BACT|nr:MAG: hydrogenase [Candidatus Wallbacteria bacterium HGW-Wallbacteria-1]
MTNYLDALSVLLLVSAFILMGNKRTGSYIKTFQFQSALVALLTGMIGITSFTTDGRIDVLIICAIVVGIKVVFIPYLLKKTYAKVAHQVEKDFFLNIPLLVIICCFIVVFCYFAIAETTGINAGIINNQIVNSVSVILIGLFFMISRKKAIGQIVGFLVIENGIFVTALFATHGMPFIVDIGILMDILVAVVIMGMMVFKIDEKFGNINVDKIKDLRG